MKRRSQHDSLAPISEPAFLVERNLSGDLLKSIPIEPNADLRAILTAAREAKMAQGYEVTDIPRLCSFFFYVKDAKKVLVSIERANPGHPKYAYRS